MFKYVAMAILLALATAAPSSDPKPHATLINEAELHHNPSDIAASVAASSAAIAGNSASSSAGIDAGPGIGAGISAGAGSSSGAASGLAPTGKQLLLADLPLVKTPASTAKLTPLVAPLVGPISPLAYATPTILAPYPAWSGLAALPASYSIEQHGYHIAY